MPAEGGNSGTWDTVLNTMFEQMDTDVFDIQTRVEALEGGGSGVGDVYASAYRAVPPFINGVAQWDGPVEYASVNVLNLALRIPLGRLAVGSEITGFASSGAVGGVRTATAALYYFDDSGWHEISAGHALGGSTTGLSHVITDDQDYFVQIIPSGGSSISDYTAVNSVTVTVE